MNYKAHITILLMFLVYFIILGIYDISTKNLMINNNTVVENFQSNTSYNDDTKAITISAVGDCVIGTGANYSYYNGFNYMVDKTKDYSYFFSGVYNILNNDDLTIANLESTFTTYTKRAIKKYNYKGDPKYVNILKEGSIEIVNIANNHSHDYLEQGYIDTINTLKKAEIEYIGYHNYIVYEKYDMKIGFAGIEGWDYTSSKNEIDKAVEYFNNSDVDIKIFSFHWGGQHVYIHNNTQEKIGKYAIDQGVDLVLGHHPHVLQGIEKYKDKYIVYSLGNFVYGGRLYPYDSDTVILQMTYFIKNNIISNSQIKLIPASMTSGKNNINNYRPIPLDGNAKKRVIDKINNYSKNFRYQL